jgi:RND family efflux transporter MFP subunit
MKSTIGLLLTASALGVSACSEGPHRVPEAYAAAAVASDVYVVRDTTVAATLTAAGVARPFAEATLSTKLMGSVTSVSVNEGDRVVSGQVLVRIDARDIDAKREQARAAMASAEAVQREAALQTTRWRALYADSAAPRAQLDASEAALDRANAGLQTARAAQTELAALGDYAVVRAPFAGIVTQRLVDPGAFAAPGTPLIAVQDDSRLRVTVSISPGDAKLVRRGAALNATIEGLEATAIVEGVFPAGPGRELYSINALVPNREGRLPSGAAAVLSIPVGTRTTVLVPSAAIQREGSLTGVVVTRGGSDTVRWIRLGPAARGFAEVLGGLRAGDSIRVPRAEAR